MAALLADDATTPPTTTVTAKQTVTGWALEPEFPDNFEVDDPTGSGTWTLAFKANETTKLIEGVTATFAGSTGG